MVKLELQSMPLIVLTKTTPVECRIIGSKLFGQAITLNNSPISDGKVSNLICELIAICSRAVSASAINAIPQSKENWLE